MGGRVTEAVSPVRILVEGRPGSGKTTVARRLVTLLRGRGVAPIGFTTEEIRGRGKRVGFEVETASGERAVLAHVDLAGPPRVGRYGVDLAAFERLAVPQLAAAPGRVAVIDEIGKMELASPPFREAVLALFAADMPVVATVHVFRHPMSDALKARSDIDVIRVTPSNRDTLPERLAVRLTPP